MNNFLQIGIGGPIGVAALLCLLWASFHVIQSSSTPFRKAIWLTLVIVLPVFGFILWLFFGPRAKRS